MSKQTNIFYFELTDTFGSELNYCHVTRFKVYASTIRGAVGKVSKETGYNFKFNGSYYKAKKACIGLIEFGEYDSIEEIEKHYSNFVEL